MGERKPFSQEQLNIQKPTHDAEWKKKVYTRKNKSPEFLLEKVSLPSGGLRMVEIFGERAERFKECTHNEFRDIEKNSGFSHAELKEARGASGVLPRLDGIFLRVRGTFEELRSFVITRCSSAGAEKFFPVVELERVHRAPPAQKRAFFSSYTEKLAKLQENVSRLQSDMTEIIRNFPDAEAEDYMRIIRGRASRSGLGLFYIDAAERIVREYKKKHDAIERVYAAFPDPRVLFEKVFGEKPKGAIEVVKRPLTLNFRCEDFGDYLWAYVQGMSEHAKELIDESFIRGADLSGAKLLEKSSQIPGLEGVLVAENLHEGAVKTIKGSGQHFIDYEKGILDHEEQHAIRNLFDAYRNKTLLREEWEIFKRLYLSTEFGVNQQTKNLIKQYFRSFRSVAEDCAHDEILTYKKQGKASAEILEKLSREEKEGGIYDFSSGVREDRERMLIKLFQKQHKNDQPTDEEIQLVRDAGRGVFRDEYIQLIKRGLESYDSLIDHGFSGDQTIAFLIAEPLARWPKVITRFLNEKKRGMKSFVAENTKVQ